MPQDGNNPSIVVMPESEGATLCLRHSGLVNAADHSHLLYDNLKRISGQYGTFNLLIFYDDSYLGYTPDAADSSIRSMLDFGGMLRKLAYVNPPDTRIKLHKMLPEIFTGEVRYFDKDQLSSALMWVKS